MSWAEYRDMKKSSPWRLRAMIREAFLRLEEKQELLQAWFLYMSKQFCVTFNEYSYPMWNGCTSHTLGHSSPFQRSLTSFKDTLNKGSLFQTAKQGTKVQLATIMTDNPQVATAETFLSSLYVARYVVFNTTCADHMVSKKKLSLCRLLFCCVLLLLLVLENGFDRDSRGQLGGWQRPGDFI